MVGTLSVCGGCGRRGATLWTNDVECFELDRNWAKRIVRTGTQWTTSRKHRGVAEDGLATTAKKPLFIVWLVCFGTRQFNTYLFCVLLEDSAGGAGVKTLLPSL